MKKDPHNSLPAFWTVGRISSVYNDGRNGTYDIDHVFGSRYQKTAELLEGLPVMIDGDSMKPAVQLTLIKYPSGYHAIDLTADTAGHRFVEGLEIAALVQYDEKLADDGMTHGIKVIDGWALKASFDAAHRDMTRLNRENAAEIEAKKVLLERQKNMPFRLMLGKRVIVTEKLQTLAEFFEHRAWPTELNGEKVTWVTIGAKGWEKLENEPGMPLAPKYITKPQDEDSDLNRNPILVELYETIKDKPQQVVTTERYEPGKDYRHDGRVHRSDVSSDKLSPLEKLVIQNAPPEQKDDKLIQMPALEKKQDNRKHKGSDKPRKHKSAAA